MNWVFFLLILTAFLTSAWHQWQLQNQTDLVSPMHALTEQIMKSAGDAVTLAIGLIGVLALFMGLMKILEKTNFMNALGKLIYPLLRWLFPDVPANHPAFAAMTMNLSANMIGLGNAATPFGIKAMQELDKINPHPGVATNAMVLFLAINTSSITLLPTKIIAMRAAAGSHDAAGIIATTLVATICATIVAILSAKLLQRWIKAPMPTQAIEMHAEHERIDHYPLWMSIVLLLAIIALIPVTLLWGKQYSPWILPALIVVILTYGMIKKVEVYSALTEGAKEGFELAIKILPFLVAILVAIGMFRISGAMESFTNAVGQFTAPLGLPAEALPMVLMRPLSGSGSYGVLSEILNNPAIGPDSYVGYLVSTIMGSTETTFYVLAVYFGAVQIRRMRHALAAGLLADLASVVMSVVAVKILLF